MNTENRAPYTFSTTEEYHRRDLQSLGWELTVSNSLHPSDTPIRKILRRNASYGELLLSFLSEYVPLTDAARVLEVGGGYGYLMKDILGVNPGILPVMLDISPALLKKQEETLAGHDITYYLKDALEMDRDFYAGFDLIIFNENLGDFPTLIDVDPDILEGGHAHTDDTIALIRRFFDTYGLERPSSRFSLNIGAMRMLEKVCEASTPHIFIGEHSCEWQMPPDVRPYFNTSATGDPRRIRLKGHDEYTIKFSYLESIASHKGFEVKRGPFADFIVPDINDYVRAVLQSRGLYSDSEEMICQFVGDLYEYEYLILTKR